MKMRISGGADGRAGNGDDRIMTNTADELVIGGSGRDVVGLHRPTPGAAYAWTCGPASSPARSGASTTSRGLGGSDRLGGRAGVDVLDGGDLTSSTGAAATTCARTAPGSAPASRASGRTSEPLLDPLNHTANNSGKTDGEEDAMERREPEVRELFIEELATVTGGANPLEKLAIWKWLQDQLVTTYGCGEEGPQC